MSVNRAPAPARARFVILALAAMLVMLFGGSGRAAISYTNLYTAGKPASFYSAIPSGYQTAAGGQLAGAGWAPSPVGQSLHALLWTPSAPTGIDLNPTGYTESRAWSTNGAHQVGYAQGPTTDNRSHAMLWKGSGASRVFLNPPGFVESSATGVSATHQVGYGGGSATSFRTHALLWSGSAASYVDLHPTGFSRSIARATSGTQQVGYAIGPATGENPHAVLWSGSAASAVDLHPSGALYSNAFATDGVRQGGNAYLYNATTNAWEIHAILWNGSATGYIDLHPGSGFTSSSVLGMSGTMQVGSANIQEMPSAIWHAMVWSGTGASGIDLHSVLPASFYRSSAHTIDGNTIYGVAIDTSENYHAIAWHIPEPGSLLLLFGGACAASLWRRRRN